MSVTKKGWDQNLMASVFKKEATYNAGVTITATEGCSFLAYEFESGIDDVVTNDKSEVTGKEHGYTQEITQYKCSPIIKFPKVTPNALAAFAGLVLGSVTSTKDGAVTAYKHKIVRVADGTALPSIAIVHKIGGIQTQYKGLKGNTLKLFGEEGGGVSMECGLMGSGTRATDAQSFAAAISESWIKNANGTVWLETGANISIDATLTQAAENISSATPDDIKARVKSFEFNWDNALEAQFGFGGTDLVLLDAHYGRRKADLKVTARFYDSTEIGYFTSQAVCAFEMDWKGSIIASGGTMYFGAQLIIPRCFLKKNPQPKGGVDDTLTQEFEFDIYDDGTNAPAILEVYNAQAAYMVAP
ncbi:MAG: phage tail tube protein [Candidatus Omnitrophica bacterium]|nr:phage tail tube protein [Candidatus Omnitrophota bacterium]